MKQRNQVEAVVGEDSGDPITLAVIAGALDFTVRQMTTIIQRTARSPVIALGNDFSNAVYTTVNGFPEMILQGQDQPVHLGGMLVSVKSVSEYFGADLAPGDIIARNEPQTGGSHLADLDIMQPAFVDGEIVGWSCSRAHVGDIGGPIPGAYNPLAEEVFAEGLVVPPIKIVERFSERREVWNLILRNVRIPDLMRGDIGAQVSAVRDATRRLEAMFTKYGKKSVDSAMRQLLDRAERLMRQQIAQLPDGVYAGESWIEGYGQNEDLALRCSIEIRGDEMTVSVAAPPQGRDYRNSYAGLAKGAVYLGLLTGIDRGLPINEGLYRPIKIDLGPAGSRVNATYPAACSMSTSCPWENLFDAVCDAMSRIVPHRAFGGWPHVAINAVSGIDPRTGDPYGGLMHVTFQGGAGAVYGMDGGGLWGTAATGGAASVGDIELLEFRLPVHFHRHELLEDSGCPGRWRGSPGAIADIEIVDHTAIVTHLGDGTKFPPASRLGGGSTLDSTSRVHRKTIHRADGSEEELPLHAVVRMDSGDRLIVHIPGGGGVGPASQRDPVLVARDVLEGYVSEASAALEYRQALLESPTVTSTDSSDKRKKVRHAAKAWGD